ncbi:hypothetical protein [Methylobacterium nigriterrae]|uniref:hypothetical protein n=1 Tax=Methylobacterium nigriterrae TaxID=3127512 RepID=UPI0030132B38
MFATDDITESPAILAFDALQAAERHLLSLTLRICEGSTRYAFPKHDPDTAITRAVGEITRCRYEFDRALASEAAGEPFRVTPTTATLCVELQRRITRNEEKSSVPSLGPTIAAARRVDTQSDADREAGFVSAVG